MFMDEKPKWRQEIENETPEEARKKIREIIAVNKRVFDELAKH
jgi:hypothetical protein